jgi:hypothetical protein
MRGLERYREERGKIYYYYYIRKIKRGSESMYHIGSRSGVNWDSFRYDNQSTIFTGMTVTDIFFFQNEQNLPAALYHNLQNFSENTQRKFQSV